MKRRPTAADRNIADFVRNLRHGEWRIDVEEDGKRMVGFGLARFKVEGGGEVRLDDRTLTFIPVDSQLPSP